MVYRIFILCTSWLLAAGYFPAAGTTLSGRVLATDGTALPGAHVKLNDLMTITSADGSFTFAGLMPGTYGLAVTFTGFRTKKLSITLAESQQKQITVTLSEAVTELKQAVVTASSQSSMIRQHPLAVTILEGKTFRDRDARIPELLNTVSGVQVRQNGGVGNQAEISIQGLTGRQVRIFIDEIPLDNLLPSEELGVGPALSMIPADQVERLEVYKGALPVRLGADALGGAINLVTRKDLHNAAEISLARSSFHTWQASVSGHYNLGKHLFAGLNTFYLASDNDYQVDDVVIVNSLGNPEAVSTTKFHDRFKSYLLQGSLGLRDKPWADRLLLNLAFTDLYDEIQHNFEMRQPYGQALNQAGTTNTSLTYEKYEIAGKLDLKIFAGYNHIRTAFTDTTAHIYNWYGEIIGRKNSGGEITASRNDLSLTGKNITGRLNFTYRPGPQTVVSYNSVAASFSRRGEDPVAAEFYGVDFFKDPVFLSRSTHGLGLNHRFASFPLTSQTAVKLYQFASDGFLLENGTRESVSQDLIRPGFSQSFKWEPKKTLLVKAAYEYATRIPDRLELLGDFSMAINANPNLKPETSHNLNLGLHLTGKTWQMEVNGFYRDVRDIILLQAVPPPVLSKYENLLKTHIAGVEGSAMLQPASWVSFRVSATYQDLRNRSDKNNAGVSTDRFFGARLPNRPYLFGNGGVQVRRKGFLQTGDKLQFRWHTNYVRAFFRYWDIDGRTEDKLTVPSQWLHDASLTYTVPNGKLICSLESRNLTDNKAFDNFRVQRPGRSFHAKIRLIIAEK